MATPEERPTASGPDFNHNNYYSTYKPSLQWPALFNGQQVYSSPMHGVRYTGNSIAIARAVTVHAIMKTQSTITCTCAFFASFLQESAITTILHIFYNYSCSLHAMVLYILTSV